MLDTAHKKLRPLRGRSYQKLRPSCVHMWTGTLLGYAMMHILCCYVRTRASCFIKCIYLLYIIKHIKSYFFNVAVCID